MSLKHSLIVSCVALLVFSGCGGGSDSDSSSPDSSSSSSQSQSRSSFSSSSVSSSSSSSSSFSSTSSEDNPCSDFEDITYDDYEIALTDSYEDETGFTLGYQSNRSMGYSVNLRAIDNDQTNTPITDFPSINIQCPGSSCGTDLTVRCDYSTREINGTEATCYVDGSDDTNTIHFPANASVRAGFLVMTYQYNSAPDQAGNLHCALTSWGVTKPTDTVLLQYTSISD